MSEDGFIEGEPRFELKRFRYTEAVALSRALDLAEPVAVALVRRGFRTVEEAAAFLAADECHDPSEFAGIGVAVDAIRGAIARGERISVHGDYDVDGTASTAILVATLHELGAECDWLIPGRVDDGYGVTAATVERLAARGTRLLITADCGITSVAEVAAARGLGIETVVTDHHQPGPELPDCPIVHPTVCGYPCPDLCAAGVAHKLAAALVGVERAERDLDLVALATVADMVALRGENRALVRRGLEAARRARRPGLRALMAAASVVPERLDERDLGFRLAPRINAAGRLYRADAAVELFLTPDPARAGQIASELDRANHERRETEADVLTSANRAWAEADPGAAAPAIVVWGEGWHAGVVGICASRMAERHGKPAILIAIDEHGRGRGSGRSVPGFDLLAGLRACGDSLARYGGHRAAAGLEIEAGRLERFREDFTAHVSAALGAQPTPEREEIDAVVGGESLGHVVAAQMSRLGPFGSGNPVVRLLVPAARVADVRPMGQGERHARFSLVSGSASAAGVAFGVGSSLAESGGEGPRDVSVKLELNEWNGAVSPRVVLGSVYEAPPPPTAPDRWACADAEYDDRVEAELSRGELDATGAPLQPGAEPFALAGAPPQLGAESIAFGDAPAPLGVARERVDRRSASAVAAVAGLASSGEAVLVLCADALWRRGLVEAAAPPARFGGGRTAIVASRGSIAAGLAAAQELREAGGGGVVLADWAALALAPQLAGGFVHVVVADPAPHPRLAALVASAAPDCHGYLHLLASSAQSDLALRALDLALPLRAVLGDDYRALRVAARDGALDAPALRRALCGASGDGRSPEAGARAMRVLSEVGVVRLAGSGPDRSLEVVSSVRGDLDETPSFIALKAAHEECSRFLTEAQTPSSSRLRAAA